MPKLKKLKKEKSELEKMDHENKELRLDLEEIKLQLLRQNLKKEIKKAAKENVRVIPQIIDNKLMIAWVKNSVAKKYGYG